LRQTAIAKRYAKALFLLAEESNNAALFKEQIGSFAELIKKNPDISEAISSPRYPVEKRWSILEAILKKSNYNPVVTNFLKLLCEKKRFAIVAEVAEYYIKLCDEKDNVAQVFIKTAVPLNDDYVKRICTKFEKLLKKRTIPVVQIEPALIGGIVTSVGDLVLDGSLRAQLNNIVEYLKKG
jgi:F-type H+-transporting ATPase subunit delta